jgi:hypothetical protein
MVVGIVGAPILLILGASALGTYSTYRDVERIGRHSQAEFLAAGTLLEHLGPDSRSADLDLADLHLVRAMNDVRAVDRKVGTHPVLTLGSVVPGIDRQVQGLRAITKAGLNFAEAAREGVAIAKNLLAVRDGTGSAVSPGEKVVRAIADTEPGIRRVEARLVAARQNLTAVDPRQLWSPLKSSYLQMEPRLAKSQKLIDEYSLWKPALISLLGGKEPKTYLVLNQDSAELRPAGGFIGSIGYLHLDRGKSDRFEFHSIDSIEPTYILPGVPGYERPPLPLRRITGITGWKLADSNWSPDFPDSAREAERFLKLETGRQVDGVIAIDPYLIESLLRQTGPIGVPEVRQTLTEQNFFLTSLNLSGAGGQQRKDFLSFFGQRLLDRLTSSAPAAWPALGQIFQDSCLRHDIQAAFHDEKVQSLVRRFHCTGELYRGLDDYVFAVDANLAGGKDQYWLERVFTGQVELQPDGVASHAITIGYRNPAIPSPMSWDYNNYLRVFLPARARISSVKGLTEMTVTSESGRTVVAGWMSIVKGRTHSVSVRYDVPEAWSLADGYRLYWQKQAGTRDDPLQLVLSLPPNMRAAEMTPAARANDGKLDISIPLHQDREFRLTLAPAGK